MQHLKHFKTACIHGEMLHKQRNTAFWFVQKGTSQFRKWKLFLTPPFVLLHIDCWPVPWSPLPLPLAHGPSCRKTPVVPHFHLFPLPLFSERWLYGNPPQMHARGTRRPRKWAGAILNTERLRWGREASSGPNTGNSSCPLSSFFSGACQPVNTSGETEAKPFCSHCLPYPIQNSFCWQLTAYIYQEMLVPLLLPPGYSNI